MSISRFASLTTLLLAIMLTGAACNSSGSAGAVSAATEREQNALAQMKRAEACGTGPNGSVRTLAEERAVWRTRLVQDIPAGRVPKANVCGLN